MTAKRSCSLRPRNEPIASRRSSHRPFHPQLPLRGRNRRADESKFEELDKKLKALKAEYPQLSQAMTLAEIAAIRTRPFCESAAITARTASKLARQSCGSAASPPKKAI